MKDDSNVVVAQYDCSTSNGICVDLGLVGTPTIFVMVPGKKYDAHIYPLPNEYTVDHFIQWYNGVLAILDEPVEAHEAAAAEAQPDADPLVPDVVVGPVKVLEIKEVDIYDIFFNSKMPT